MPPLANSSVGSDGLHTPWQFGPRSSLLSRVPEPLLPCMQLYIVFSSWLEYILFLPLSVSKFLGPLYLPCMQLYIVFSSWLEYILFLPLSVSKFLGPL